MDDDSMISELLAQVPPEQRPAYIKSLAQAIGNHHNQFTGGSAPQTSGDWVSNINRQAAEILKESGVDLDPDSPEYGRFIKPHESGNPDDYLKGTKRYSSVRKATARLEELQAKGLNRTLEERQEARRLVEEINRLEREGK